MIGVSRLALRPAPAPAGHRKHPAPLNDLGKGAPRCGLLDPAFESRRSQAVHQTNKGSNGVKQTMLKGFAAIDKSSSRRRAPTASGRSTRRRCRAWARYRTCWPSRRTTRATSHSPASRPIPVGGNINGANAAPRCGAKRRDGGWCLQPGMTNRPAVGCTAGPRRAA